MPVLRILSALLAVLLAFLLLLSSLLLMGTLAMRALHRRRRGVLRVSRLSGLLLASAFLGFQKIVHPHVRHAVVEELQERTDADHTGEPAPPGGHEYHRQLRSIRRGKEVDELQPIREDPPF